ncbi:hypothetical protein FRB98_001677 [Tulasnella sp. 332]|nr:hypothetical protein FRB98_001677 [Tulasnella sp. 332]
MKSVTTSSALSLAAVIFFLPSVASHGFLRTLKVDGKAYYGREPGTGAGPSSSTTTVIRTIDNTNPLHLSDAKISSYLSCGRGAATRGAPHHASVKPGSNLVFHWDAGDGSAWPHDSGPMITYIASCGNAGCSKVDSSKAKWWKLNQVGKVSTPGNNWVQGKVHKGQSYSFKLPKNMPDGNFLLRHEIIALHLADKVNGAEFYPSCSQITVTGGPNKKMTGMAVKFPGAYHLTDKGIHINIWDSLGTYHFPGPALAVFTVDEDDREDGDEDCDEEEEEPAFKTKNVTVTKRRSGSTRTNEAKSHVKLVPDRHRHRANHSGARRIASSSHKENS